MAEKSDRVTRRDAGIALFDARDIAPKEVDADATDEQFKHQCAAMPFAPKNKNDSSA